jgi:hypothetical protein
MEARSAGSPVPELPIEPDLDIYATLMNKYQPTAFT